MDILETRSNENSFDIDIEVVTFLHIDIGKNMHKEGRTRDIVSTK